MYLVIVFLPLISSIICGLFGRFLGRKGAGLISSALVSTSAILSYVAVYEVGLLGSPCYITLGTWIDVGILNADWGFLFDSLTVIMLIVVNTVSALVHIYSTGYMSEDPHVPRFMAYLSLFTFFMLMLVTGDNLVQLFLGWEGVGLCSYLLINFWFTRIQANKSAIKAMIVNRVGDFGLSLGMMAVFVVFRTVDFETIFATAPQFQDLYINFLGFEFHALTTICLLLFVGAVGKSAQLGLHTWLPDAMEGPTPVSALIHAATMVTAGVFLIIRCSPLFEYAPFALTIITVVGALTAFFAATVGLVQNDLKRVIAYSTCSQLGYMVFACGISNYAIGLFHLMNHAFFKALSFLGAGAVIHAMSDEQDMRRMGGLAKIVPMSYTMMMIGSMSLMGFPFLTGFYSKDVILEVARATYTISGQFAYWLGTTAAFFTAFYSFRLVYYTFLCDTNAYKKNIEHAHDAPIVMAIPLMILAVGSIFVGYATKDMIIGLGTGFWGSAILTLPKNTNVIDAEFLPATVKLIPVILSIIGATLAILLNTFSAKLVYALKVSYLGRNVFGFLTKKWYFDIIYNEFLVRTCLNFGYKISFKLLDRGVIELIGPFGIVKVVTNLVRRVSLLQTGFIFNYAFMMLSGVTFILVSLLFWNYFSFSFEIYPIIMFIMIVLIFSHNSKTNSSTY